MYKQLVANALLVGVSVFLLYHFIKIWQLGRFYIQEPNKLILTAETVVMACILGYGVYMLVRWVRD